MLFNNFIIFFGDVMKGFTKLGRTLLALAVLAIMPLSASAQNLVNSATGATYNATCGAVIKFKNTTGRIDNGGTNTLGTAALPVPGIVDYAAAAGNQTVYEFYYTRLFLSGASTKNVEDGVNVTAGDACSLIPAAYVGLETYPYYVTTASGDRTYNGTFTYSGTNVNIFPENTPSSGSDYNVLELAGTGTFNILASDDVVVSSSISNDLGGTFNVSGGLTTGSDPSLLAGTVNIDNTGNITNGSGTLDFTSVLNVTNGVLESVTGSGIVTFGPTSTVTLANAGVLNFVDNTSLVISGDITNNGDGTNLIFACESNVIYNGALGQVMLPTLFTNPYGNLLVQGASKTPGGDMYLCNDFSLEDNDLTMGNFYIAMKEEEGDATYPDDNEVIGRFRRYFNGSTDALVFNNSATSLELTSNPNSVNFITLNVKPNATSEIPGYEPTTDATRGINYDYDQTAGNWGATLQFGYKNTELDAGVDTEDLRMREVVGAVTEKIATGVAKTHSAGSPFSSVTLAAIRPTGGLVPPQSILAEVADNNLIYLSGAATTFISVSHGRWSNPGTWDEGMEPTPTDSAIVRHQVHTGFTRTAGDNYITAEAYPNQLARGVYVDNNSNAALLFGQVSAQGVQSPLAAFSYNQSLTSTINVAQGDVAFANPNLAALAAFVTTAPASYERRGLVVFEGATLGAKWITNTGYIHNAGTIEIGD